MYLTEQVFEQAEAVPSTLSAATSNSSLSSSQAEVDSDAQDAQDKDGKKKKNRCATCRKKVGLTGQFTPSTYAQLAGFLKSSSKPIIITSI